MNKDLRILVTGVKGQLGYDCVRELKERGYLNVSGIDYEDLDITDEIAVHRFIDEYKPDVIMHNAAYTAVDKAELFSEEAYKVNALGTKYIAEACKDNNAKMIYISTDYVFNGKGDIPFEVNDIKEGLSIYGKTKSEGEDFVKKAINSYFIVRTSWVFGINGNNFIKTMLNLAKTKKEINVVDDQIGSPTYTYDLSKLLCDMMETDKYGIYHATNEGYCSWYELTKYIYSIKGINDVIIHPIHTDKYVKIVLSQAKRPLNSRLSKRSLDEAGFKRLPTWQDAVNRFLKDFNI